MKEIRGDRLEQSRIRLERDIDNNIPSPPSMSSGNPTDVDYDDISSVDFARHNSHPQASFHSFDHLSHLDSDFYSRHGDDDSIALDPDLGHTMSTAAHHASALTLSAGLRGRSSYHHTPGRTGSSGAEFDPERPLQDILDSRMVDGISLFNATGRSKSKSVKSHKEETRSVPTFDPVIVDSTAELDRFLRTGHQRPHTSLKDHSYVTRSHSQPSPVVSDASDSDNPTPRLTHALGQQFSPKRPRSTPVSIQPLYPPPRHVPTHDSPVPHSLPRSNKLRVGPSNLNPARHNPTHSARNRPSSDSQSSKVARRIACDNQAQNRFLSRDGEHNVIDATSRPSRQGISPPAPSAGSGKRPPFTDIVNMDLNDARPKTGPRAFSRVQLPDVTGLTSAVQSPVKGGDGYAAADVAHPSLAVDLLPALDALQMRLQALERENGVSRRRVTELELELEDCKIEVAKERTRVRERERERDEEAQIEWEREKERRVRGRMYEEENRYREVVEEKKALEALISTLRTHLARLTSELASHKSLIADMRADTYATRETQAEVEALRAEVERLAGEVERLKEIVEEGLRERRRAKLNTDSRDGSAAETDQAVEPAQVGIDMTYVTASASRGEAREEPMIVVGLDPGQEQEQEQECDSRHERDNEPGPMDSLSRRFIDATELARVESDMHERRSERSRSTSNEVNNSGNRMSEGEPERGHDVRAEDEGLSPVLKTAHPTVQPAQARASERSNFGSRQRNVTAPKQPVPDTPFPQIRGSRMERLFFSAPEHNARTCTVCCRRKRGGQHRRVYLKDGRHREKEEEEEAVKTYLHNQGTRGNNRERRNEVDVGEKLPPQTVLARVVRELEDDFSHYKAIYLELAEQYGVIDAASNVAKRNVLADHLREVIDTLEQKGDQIASLYDLLDFRDQPLPRDGIPSRPKYSFV